MSTSAWGRVCPLNHVVDFNGKTPDIIYLRNFTAVCVPLAVSTLLGLSVAAPVHMLMALADGNARKQGMLSEPHYLDMSRYPIPRESSEIAIDVSPELDNPQGKSLGRKSKSRMQCVI